MLNARKDGKILLQHDCFSEKTLGSVQAETKTRLT